MRNLKAMGLALVAMLALGVFASAAQAEGPEGAITASEYPASLHAETNESEKFTAFEKEVTCQENTYTATVAGETGAVTITPEYKGCHVPARSGSHSRRQ